MRSKCLRWSNALVCNEASGLDGGTQRLVVAFVPTSIAFREVADRSVEAVLLAEVGGDRDGISGARVRPGEGLTTQPRAERQTGRHHRLDDGRSLHVSELSPVEITVGLDTFRPAQEDVAGGLHH